MSAEEGDYCSKTGKTWIVAYYSLAAMSGFVVVICFLTSCVIFNTLLCYIWFSMDVVSEVISLLF